MQSSQLWRHGALAAMAVFTLAACSETADGPTGVPATEAAFAPGNGMGGIANQTDYKLNIIGVPKDKTADMDDNNGRRIFVQLYGGQKVCVTDEDWATYLDLIGEPQSPNPYACTDEEWADALQGGRGKNTGGWDALDKTNKILLTPNSEDLFSVLDANATDSDGAEFTMPDDVASHYEVYARALGKPGGKAAITLCANETSDTNDDIDGDGIDDTETWCSINQALLERTKGQPKTVNVTDELFTLTILVDPDAPKDESLAFCLIEANLLDLGDGDVLTDDTQVSDVPIFHSCFEDYFWNYDNNGLKLLQLWFVQKPTV